MWFEGVACLLLTFFDTRIRFDELGVPQYFKWGNLQGQAFFVDRIRRVQSAITIDRYFCGKLTID